jgi:hypothetical protein
MNRGGCGVDQIAGVLLVLPIVKPSQINIPITSNFAFLFRLYG